MKQFVLSIMIFVTCVSIIIFNCNKPIPSINQKSYCDSISALNFEYEIRLNRYEITLEILRDENPKLAEEFETIMSTQTE